AISFKAVSAGADRITGIVSGAIGYDAGVAGVVFLNLEHNLHQVGANVGDLGEDASSNTERRRAQRLANSEADEAGASVVSGNKQQDDEHHEQLNADQHHANAHAGFKGNFIDGEWLARESSERGARIREGIYANAEPCHAVAARNTNHAEQQDDDHAHGFILQEHTEVEDDDDRDESPQQQQEFSLGDEVGLASLVNEFRNLA